jgi:organic radical activating enzyme
LKSDPVEESGQNQKQRYRRLSTDELVAEVRQYKSIKHAIISGGEPTLQNLAPLAEALKATHSLEVETNGTQIPHQLHKSFTPSHYDLFQWNISPKGKNAGQELNSEALGHWAELSQTHPATFFKFVIRSSAQKDDVEEVKSILKEFRIADNKVILMAEGTTTPTQTNNAWLEELCLTEGWRMTLRLHVLNHGATRGV